MLIFLHFFLPGVCVCVFMFMCVYREFTVSWNLFAIFFESHFLIRQTIYHDTCTITVAMLHSGNELNSLTISIWKKIAHIEPTKQNSHCNGMFPANSGLTIFNRIFGYHLKTLTTHIICLNVANFTIVLHYVPHELHQSNRNKRPKMFIQATVFTQGKSTNSNIVCKL